jgi:hypothetical protein
MGISFGGAGECRIQLALLIGLLALVAHQAARLNLLITRDTVTVSTVALFRFGFPDFAIMGMVRVAACSGSSLLPVGKP